MMQKRRRTGEKPKEERVNDEGRWGVIVSSIRSSQGGRIGCIGKSESGMLSNGSPKGFPEGRIGTSLLASNTIFPNVQLIAISPTVSTDWNVGRPRPFRLAFSATSSPCVVPLPPGSTKRGMPIPSCSTFAIQAALKHCICRRGISTLLPHLPTSTTLPSSSI